MCDWWSSRLVFPSLCEDLDVVVILLFSCGGVEDVDEWEEAGACVPAVEAEDGVAEFACEPVCDSVEVIACSGFIWEDDGGEEFDCFGEGHALGEW